MDFSLFYFANDSGENAGNRYELLLEGARFADRHGFCAVWTPERHFHRFGGVYPNPSVTGAAIAAVTENLHIRAGSVVPALHNPIRVAEEWSVVDNLSHGRVGISFASGWHARDFCLAQDAYADRRQILFDRIDLIRRLWRGELLSTPDGDGKLIDITIYPPPVQAELPVWVTSAGDVETFRSAGRIGAGLLTHLLGKEFDQLAMRIGEYRKAVAEREGADGWPGHVALMLHTFLGADEDDVREQVRPSLLEYLREALSLQLSGARRLDPAKMREEDVDFLVNRFFDRYYQEGGLLGTVSKAERIVDRMRGIGVDEIACLIDFGLPTPVVLSSLEYLRELRERVDG